MLISVAEFLLLHILQVLEIEGKPLNCHTLGLKVYFKRLLTVSRKGLRVEGARGMQLFALQEVRGVAHEFWDQSVEQTVVFLLNDFFERLCRMLVYFLRPNGSVMA
jgi:uncharacterized membrane protein